MTELREEAVEYFTETEEEFVVLLCQMAMRKNTAKLLVFLAGRPEASSRAIEHGTDLRQPEISIAVNDMKDRGWITYRAHSPDKKGRPAINYSLAKPLPEIIDGIEKTEKREASRQLELIRKMRDYSE